MGSKSAGGGGCQISLYINCQIKIYRLSLYCKQNVHMESVGFFVLFFLFLYIYIFRADLHIMQVILFGFVFGSLLVF